MNDTIERLAGEWPAVLAIVTLVLAHVYLTAAQGETNPPLGLPLIAAILVFLGGEVVRRVI